MIAACAFQTRARTLDHLGREQIADCPTAISELWKNSYDAYARNVQLDIFDGEQPVAAISDDGHGMNREEFLDRWLVVGTESKATVNRTPLADRNGLKVRERQGQKGIGRLSCANLGPVLLLVSKRTKHPFVAALIDWRLFENPFINLSDIYVPMAEFDGAHHLFEELPDLFSALAENVTGGDEAGRKARLQSAWDAYDRLHHQEDRNGTRRTNPSSDILSTVSHVPFTSRHLQQWPIWTGASDHGTALLVSGINYDLSIHIAEGVDDASARAAKERLFETLSSFVDPFVDPSDPSSVESDPQFSYAVHVRRGDSSSPVVGTEKQFDKHLTDGLEHRIEGHVDSEGVFRGRVRAFGQWISEECEIEAPEDLYMPQRANTLVGPFSMYIASLEFAAGGANTTHTDMEFERYQELAAKYSGFMIFRDGLRVLPYGRTDNDFFEIESRRSRSAGREFWNHRQMFGRIAITRRQNPNLKDKAGREGLLDNRAAKTLKVLVSNILKQSARKYFGSASDYRKNLLPEITEDNKRKRAAEARNLLRKRQRRAFRTKLNRLSRELPIFLQEVESFRESLNIKREADIARAQASLDVLRERLPDFSLPGAPKNLGSLQNKHADYRRAMASIRSSMAESDEYIDQRVEEITPTHPRVLLEKQLARQAAQANHRIGTWKKSIADLQRAEFKRIGDLIKQRNKLFHSEAQPFLHRFDTGELSYAETSALMDLLKQRLDEENSDLFTPYVSALESLQDSVDLEHLATFGMEELNDLRVELDRLNSLAQLGIAVEIVGHELQSYDDIIGSALNRLPKDLRDTPAVKDIEFGYEGLTDQLRFLSPLRLAGQKIQRWVSGAEMADYVGEFFAITLVKNKITFSTTEEFRRFRVFDQPSRLYPVFINLLNNSIYWVGLSSNDDRRIAIGLIDHDVVVSDNGPGVDSEDVDSLFTLFFTRKARGGRGVGLYLCRANLTAGGHRISYEPNTKDMPLHGANFLISFRGAEFDDD